MKRKLILIAVVLALCVLGLCACRNRAVFSGGESLSGEEAQQRLDAMQGTQSVSEEKVYYFVAGSGEAYHSDGSCAYLKNSEHVQAGSLSEAIAAGKVRLCTACAQKEGNEPLQDAVQDGRTCYYTVGGKVWHYDKECPSLANSNTVYEGTVEQAMLEGKSRVCSRCGDE